MATHRQDQLDRALEAFEPCAKRREPPRFLDGLSLADRSPTISANRHSALILYLPSRPILH
jgi:hypothetical protein